MIYHDINLLIGNVPEGYEWIVSFASAFVLCMYVYTFIRIVVNLFSIFIGDK